MTTTGKVFLSCAFGSGIGALVGTAIGYFAGNVIIGMLVGGLLGDLNHKVISKWCLRLVPSR